MSWRFCIQNIYNTCDVVRGGRNDLERFDVSWLRKSWNSVSKHVLSLLQYCPHLQYMINTCNIYSEHNLTHLALDTITHLADAGSAAANVCFSRAGYARRECNTQYYCFQLFTLRKHQAVFYGRQLCSSSFESSSSHFHSGKKTLNLSGAITVGAKWESALWSDSGEESVIFIVDSWYLSSATVLPNVW